MRRKREASLLIRLSTHERRRWSTAAVRNDLTVSEMVREAVRVWIDVRTRWQRDCARENARENGARR